MERASCVGGDQSGGLRFPDLGWRALVSILQENAFRGPFCADEVGKRLILGKLLEKCTTPVHPVDGPVFLVRFSIHGRQ